MGTNLKFNSAICTSREQSERLLALGLKKETADAIHRPDGCVMPLKKESFIHSSWGKAIPVGYSPAWSLHRLIEMYTKHYVCEHINLKLLTYDTIIENIRLDILTGTFNKEYLEE